MLNEKERIKDTFKISAGLTFYFYDTDSIKKDFGDYDLIKAELINEPKDNVDVRYTQRFWNIVCKKTD